MRTPPLKLNAHIVKQGKTVFYETSIPALELLDENLFKVDRWSTKEGSTGYQRDLSVTHIRNIARYIQGEESTNVLPTSIILNSRKPLDVTKQNDHVVLDLTDKHFPLYITDGQHRIEALRLAHNQGVALDDYNMAVTVTNFDLADEIQHFRKINIAANKAPRGLDQQLGGRLAKEFGLPRSADEKVEDRVTQIVTRLVTDIESPWFDRIALGGGRKKLHHTTTQYQLTRTLKPMFTRGRFANLDESMNQPYQIIFDFWTAVCNQFPEAYETPTKYSIQRYTGVRAWNVVLERVLNLNLNPSQEQMEAAIEHMKDKVHMDDSFWEIKRGRARTMTAQYGTIQAAALLADEIWYNLDKNALRENVRA